jgi:hypothetical protein
MWPSVSADILRLEVTIDNIEQTIEIARITSKA